MDLPITVLVLEKLDCNILAGIPFCKTNNIHIHLKSKSLSIRDCTVPYGSSDGTKEQSKIFRVESYILWNDAVQVLMPGDYVELQDDNLRKYKGEVSIEPPIDSPYQGKLPPRFISRVIEGIPNLTGEPIKISKFFR